MFDGQPHGVDLAKLAVDVVGGTFTSIRRMIDDSRPEAVWYADKTHHDFLPVVGVIIVSGENES
jgi:hypothetical protein